MQGYEFSQGSSRPPRSTSLCALEFRVDEQETFAAAQHVLGQRRAFGSERHLARWLFLEDLGQRLGQLRVLLSLTIIFGASLVVHHVVDALDGEDPRPRAFRAI